jgi:hypothetical protein
MQDAPKAPLMPREVIEPRLETSCLTTQDSLALLRIEAWNCLESRIAQLVFLADFAEIECVIPFDTQGLADLFQVTRSCACRMLYKARLRDYLSRLTGNHLSLKNLFDVIPHGEIFEMSISSSSVSKSWQRCDR